MNRRERQVAWALGRRERQVACELAWDDFQRLAWRAAPSGAAGEQQPGELHRRPFTVVAVDAFLVASRVRLRINHGFRVEWQSTAAVVAAVVGGILGDELRALELVTPTRGRDEVADWVITRALYDAIRAGHLRA